jgi:hypothetical protein
MLDLSGDNNHATAPSDAARPTLRLDGNGKWYLERDLVSNNLPVTWPTVLSDAQLGPELVTSLDFTSGWTDVNVSSTPSASSFVTSNSGGKYKDFGLIAGKTYYISASATKTNASSSLSVNNSAGLSTPVSLNFGTSNSPGQLSATFIAASASLYFRVSLADTVTISGLSVREVTGTNVIYTATGDYTTKDSGLILSGATNYTTPKYDYGRIVLKSPSALDAKIIKYLDQKRGRTYQLGPELVTNGGFDSDTAWTTGTGWTISNGVAICTNTIDFQLSQSISIVSNKVYLLKISITERSAGSIFASLGTTASGYRTPTIFSVGAYEYVLVAGATTSLMYVYPNSTGTTLSIDNVSVREVIIT